MEGLNNVVLGVIPSQYSFPIIPLSFPVSLSVSNMKTWNPSRVSPSLTSSHRSHCPSPLLTDHHRPSQSSYQLHMFLTLFLSITTDPFHFFFYSYLCGFLWRFEDFLKFVTKVTYFSAKGLNSFFELICSE